MKILKKIIKALAGHKTDTAKLKEQLNAKIEKKQAKIKGDFYEQVLALEGERDALLEDVVKDPKIGSKEREALGILDDKFGDLLSQKDEALEQMRINFDSLSRKAQKVVIAEDVLASLKVGLYKATSDKGYFEPDGDLRFKHGNDSFQELAIAEELGASTCQVCALGSMLVSHVKYCNEFTVNDVAGASQNKIKETLSKYFTELETSLIETAFEKQIYFTTTVNGTEQSMGGTLEDFISDYESVLGRKPNKTLRDKLEGAMEFGKQFRGDKQRLTAIMENIVKNEGKFIP